MFLKCIMLILKLKYRYFRIGVLTGSAFVRAEQACRLSRGYQLQFGYRLHASRFASLCRVIAKGRARCLIKAKISFSENENRSIVWIIWTNYLTNADCGVSVECFTADNWYQVRRIFSVGVFYNLSIFIHLDTIISAALVKNTNQSND